MRRSLRDSCTYPKLHAAGSALHCAIFGEEAPSMWVFEALVAPAVYASRMLWDERLLGQRRWTERYGPKEVAMETSPGLAYCNVDLLHPAARLSSGARSSAACAKPTLGQRTWTAARVGALTPFVRRGLSDREAESALQQLISKGDDRKRSRAEQGRFSSAPAPKHACGEAPPKAAPKAALPAPASCVLGTSCSCTRTACAAAGRARTSRTSSSRRRGRSGGIAAAGRPATSASSPSRRASPSSSRRGRRGPSWRASARRGWRCRR